MASTLNVISDVDIDSDGVFKYILIKVSSSIKGGTIQEKTVVRGYASCPYHSDIKDKLTEELEKLKASEQIDKCHIKVLGGGRIKRETSEKSIQVYGYSQGYGRADHQITVDLLKQAFPDYEVSWTNDGY